MPTEHADVIVIGAGHNGLIVAAYLLKAGLDVIVVEKNPWIGGGTSCREINGFKLDWASSNHIMIQPNPLILNDELQLKSKYGLRYIIPEAQMANPFPDGKSMTIFRSVDRTCKHIEKLSKRDAKAYRKFAEWGIGCLDFIAAGAYNPPAPFGTMISELEKSEDGVELIRAMMMSLQNVMDEWFEDEHVKTLLMHYASELMLPPWENGTGSTLFIMLPIMHAYGMGCPVGGSGALAEALARCVQDNGGKILTNSPAKKIVVKDGKAEGITLDNGKELRAKKAVVGNLHPKVLFLDLVGEENLDSDFVRKVKRIRQSPFGGINVAWMLHEPPHFKVEDVNEGNNWEISWSLEAMMEHFQDIIFRRIPSKKACPNVVCWSKIDPSRAPPGKHEIYTWNYVPYDLKDGGPEKWYDIKEEVADTVLESIQAHTTNMGPDNIIGRLVTSPVEVERNISNTFQRSDASGVRVTLDQSFIFRPMAGWGNYKTPIEKLYMSGVCTHPGGGVMGAGRAAVQIVLQDLGIKFEDVLKKKF